MKPLNIILKRKLRVPQGTKYGYQSSWVFDRGLFAPAITKRVLIKVLRGAEKSLASPISLFAARTKKKLSWMG
jgi:hypothetical protein